MAPKDYSLLLHAADMAKLPELFMSSCEVYAMLQDLKAMLACSRADLKAPCFQDSLHGCQLPRQLEHWNRFLSHIHVQLRERNNPGELTVVCSHATHDRDPECRTKRSALFFHWLLVSHRCVTGLRVEKWGVFESHRYFTLFCDAVAKCSGLKYLHLCSPHPCPTSCKRLLDAVRYLPCLEEITCNSLHVADGPKDMTALATVIATKSKLTRLTFEKFVGETPHMSDVMLALQSNIAISHLAIDVSWLTAEDCSLFSRALQENRSLKSLRLVGSFGRPALSVAAVAGAVEKSRALTSLNLTGFRVDTSEAWSLARSLSSCEKLEQLELVSCTLVFTQPTDAPSSGLENEGDSSDGVHWTIQPFVHMLRGMKSLRKLGFPMSAYTLEEQQEFFKALEENKSVKQVRFEITDNSNLIDLLRVISETRIGAEVNIECSITSPNQLEEVSKWAQIESINLAVSGEAPVDETHERFTQLRKFYALSTLTVRVENRIEPEHAEILAQFLRDTKLLKETTMNFRAKRKESLELLGGLWHNTSITVLVIERWCTGKRSARLLCEVVCSSRRLRALTYNLYSGSPSLAFFSTLAHSIQDNFTILSVKTFRLIAAVGHLERIQEVIARNNKLLVHAARFVAGRTVDKNSAEALEWLRLNPNLVSKVREFAPIDQKRAEDAIRRRLHEMDDMNIFLKITGVVRECVTCKESTDTRADIETLPFYCWLHLRRYLRIADVVHPPERR